jgi:hypothetical protein
MRNVGAALGLGNTFAFSIYFLVPLAIPSILGVFAWQGVWFAAAVAACAASVLFPGPAGSNRA